MSISQSPNEYTRLVLFGKRALYIEKAMQDNPWGTNLEDPQQPVRTLDEEIHARAAAAGIAYGVSRAERTPKVRLALACMKAEIDELKEQITHLNQMLLQAEMRADHDALVAVYNRRGFIREFKGFLKLSRRQEIPACLAYFDLDGFKSINDRYGHAAGDAILKAVGSALKEHTRESDIVGRLGGDEFAVLLTHIETEAAQTKAEELVETIKSLNIEHESHNLRISVSFGLCLLDANAEAETQIACADRAMYANKESRHRRRA